MIPRFINKTKLPSFNTQIQERGRGFQRYARLLTGFVYKHLHEATPLLTGPISDRAAYLSPSTWDILVTAACKAYDAGQTIADIEVRILNVLGWHELERTLTRVVRESYMLAPATKTTVTMEAMSFHPLDDAAFDCIVVDPDNVTHELHQLPVPEAHRPIVVTHFKAQEAEVDSPWGVKHAVATVHDDTKQRTLAVHWVGIRVDDVHIV